MEPRSTSLGATRKRRTTVASSIEAPLEPLGLRAADGTLIPGARLSGLETMRFATEIQPLLAELPDVALEVIGDPVDYREAAAPSSSR